MLSIGGMTCLGVESARVFEGSNSVTNSLLVPSSTAAAAVTLGFDLEGREKESFMIDRFSSLLSHEQNPNECHKDAPWVGDGCS